MTAIALVTCVGFVLPEFFRRIAGTRTAISACVLIWLLSFAIISPVVFGFDLLGHSFGRFGWDSIWGRCNVTKTRDFNYNTAMIIPLIIIFIRYVNVLLMYLLLTSKSSYAALGVCYKRRQGGANSLVSFKWVHNL